MALGSAMQKIESAVIAVVLGTAFPFIVAYLVSGGASSSFLIPCSSAGSGVCTVGTVSGNVITLPQILVSTANLVITLLTGILIIFASIRANVDAPAGNGAPILVPFSCGGRFGRSFYPPCYPPHSFDVERHPETNRR